VSFNCRCLVICKFLKSDVQSLGLKRKSSAVTLWCGDFFTHTIKIFIITDSYRKSSAAGNIRVHCDLRFWAFHAVSYVEKYQEC